MATIASLTKATNPKMAVEKIYQKKMSIDIL